MPAYRFLNTPQMFALSHGLAAVFGAGILGYLISINDRRSPQDGPAHATTRQLVATYQSLRVEQVDLAAANIRNELQERANAGDTRAEDALKAILPSAPPVTPPPAPSAQ